MAIPNVKRYRITAPDGDVAYRHGGDSEGCGYGRILEGRLLPLRLESSQRSEGERLQDPCRSAEAEEGEVSFLSYCGNFCPVSRKVDRAFRFFPSSSSKTAPLSYHQVTRSDIIVLRDEAFVSTLDRVRDARWSSRSGPAEAKDIPPVHTSIVISASPLQVEVDRRNAGGLRSHAVHA